MMTSRPFYDDVASVLHLALRHLEHHLGDVHVVLRLLVEGRGEDHRLRVALHVRDFLGALVDEEDDEHRLGVVLRDGVGHLLEEHRLADARRRDDESALSEPDRRKEVDDARRELLGVGLEDDAPRRERGREVLEVDDARCDGRLLPVHGRDVAEAEEPVAVARVADRPLDDVAGPERMAADLLLGDEDVLRAREKVVLRGAQKAVSFADNLKAARGEHRAAVREIPADSGEDKFVLAVGAEFLGVCPGHHALDDLRRGPGLDVGKPVLGEIGIPVGVRRGLRLLGVRLRRERGVEKRIHALFAVRAANGGVVRLRAAAKILASAVAEPFFLAIVDPTVAALLLGLGLLGLRRGTLGDGARKHIEFFGHK